MKATLITGASSGIGEAFARRLAAEKHNLVLVARSRDKLEKLCRELSAEHQITAHFVALDLTKTDSDKKLFEETEKNGVEIDFLINNAGFGSMGYFADENRERELEMIALNISTLVGLTHLYLQKMRERKSGAVINVSSTASFQPIPFMATYAATKAFVSSFTEAIAEEYRPFGIIISAICPGPTETNFFAEANAQALKAKGMETPEQVVEVALSAVKSGKAKAISGLTNKIGAFLGSLAPNFLVTRIVAGALRSKIESRKLQKK